MSDLWTRFRTLPRPASAGTFSVAEAEGAVRIGRSFEGAPALLIVTVDRGLAPRRLANLTFAPARRMRVSFDHGASEEELSLAVLECTSTDSVLHQYFCRVAAIFTRRVADADGAADLGELERALDALMALFRHLDRAPRRSIQGLWAELAVILWSANPSAALSVWHSQPDELHDFAQGPHRLEVKSAAGPLREHHFRLSQLASATSGATLIASLLLRETEGGSDVFSLADAIAARVGEDAGQRLEAILAETLGRSWRDADADSMRFDLEEARRSLRLVRAEDVPSVALPLAAGVRQVAFVADLSGVTTLSIADARGLAPLYAALLPAHA